MESFYKFVSIVLSLLLAFILMYAEIDGWSWFIFLAFLLIFSVVLDKD